MYLSQLDCFYDIENVTCQGCKMVFNTEETETDDWFFAWEGDTTEDCCSGCYSKYAIKKTEAQIVKIAEMEKIERSERIKR